MKLAAVEQSIVDYEQAFTTFCDAYQLPKTWFLRPDHFAVKCANEIDYLETCTEFTNEVDASGIWEISMDDRLLASAKLSGKTGLAGYGFGWIEIMQPRPGKELESGFVEHTEFLFPDFFTIQKVLDLRGVDFELQRNPGHSWLNVPIDDSGREIKFNDQLLADVVVVERENGKLHRIQES